MTDLQNGTRLHVKRDEFALPSCTVMDASAAIPTVKGIWGLKYGEHAYYFMNFRSSRGLRTRISHYDVMKPGWSRLQQNAARHGRKVSRLHALSTRYHYGFNLLEQIMLMTVPHTVTFISSGRVVINYWAWCGYLLMDAHGGGVTYHTIGEDDDDSVLGSQQWYDSRTGDLYAMSFSLSDSIARIDDQRRPVRARIFRHRVEGRETDTVWEGEFADYMHDVIVNDTRQYCVACELGMYLDAKNSVVPSKVLVVDMKNNRQWILDRFVVAAHACFDSADPNVFFVSNHNFEFMHSSFVQLLKKGAYSVKFRGPASIFKYELTPEGPREIGVFTREDFFRLTNMHSFVHRGRRVMVAMGYPDVLFLIDTADMSFIKKLKVADPVTWMHGFSKKPALVGTIAPSPDGEKLFVQTTRSFQIVDVDSGECDYARNCFFSHICFNHMIATSDTAWEAQKHRLS